MKMIIKFPDVDSRWFLTSPLPDKHPQAFLGLNLSMLEVSISSFSKANPNTSQ